jgi:hypothetical protein
VNDLVLLREIRQPEKLRDLLNLLARSRSELPVRKRLVLITLRVRRAVTAQHFRRVVLGIDADAEQVCLGVKFRILAQLTIDLREVVAHQRAVLRHRTTRVNKRQQQNFTAIIMDANLTVILIAQSEIRNFVALFGNYHARHRRRICTLSRNDQIFQPRVRTINNQRRSNLVIGCKNLQV